MSSKETTEKKAEAKTSDTKELIDKAVPQTVPEASALGPAVKTTPSPAAAETVPAASKSSKASKASTKLEKEAKKEIEDRESGGGIATTAFKTENLEPGQVHPLVAESPDPVPNAIQKQVDKEREDAPLPATHSARLRIVQQFRPFIKGEDLSKIIVANEDTPEEGGMVMVDRNNPANQWYVSAAYYANFYEAI